jgi:hypothetical protein
MQPEISAMSFAVPRSQAAKNPGAHPADGRASGLRDLFAPLDGLLVCGGDPRLALDKANLNSYGCGPSPSPETWSFASSTASAISERAYARAGFARDELMRAAIDVGLDEAFDVRIEAMRRELKACLQLSRDVGVVFAASGTDAQLHALFLARSISGAGLATIVVGADQTGSGTLYTARGCHFANVTARGSLVRKGTPIPDLSCESIALPLFDGAAGVAARADTDDAVLRAIQAAVADGSDVLLHVLDSSKLGWRAPSEACLDEIGRRWPQRVQVVVDACQMRLGRARIRTYLDRGYMVLITGSKFFGGPAFSGALLVPGSILGAREAGEGLAGGLQDYASRSDWPEAWALRSRFSARPNLGQWLRWEAAVEEIKAYYRVPAAFRHSALRQLRDGVESLMARSLSLRPVAASGSARDSDDEEFACPTIFPFTIHRRGTAVSADDCQVLYRALARDLGDVLGGSARGREIAGRRCLLGQPVRIDGAQPTAALRLCFGARQVTEAWSPDAGAADHNLRCQLDRVADVVAKLELLIDRMDALKAMELSHGL